MPANVYHTFDGSEYDYGESNFKKFFGTVTGSDWHGGNIRLGNYGNTNSKTIFADADGGTGRYIGHLELGWNSNVDLISTNISMITGWGGALHDVTLGSGYYDYVSLHAARNIVTTGDGYVGHISTGGSSEISIGAGGAGTVFTWAGDDRIEVTGAVHYIYTGAGDDTIITRSNWINKMRLGAGDDTVVVAALAHGSDIAIDGSGNPANGSDTLDFSRLTQAVKFDLGAGSLGVGADYQDIYYRSATLDAYVMASGVENLIGSKKSDFLIGSSKDNELTGGKGWDILKGGGGADTFVFGIKTGRDKVVDFEIGTDILKIEGHPGGFAALVFSGGDIILDGGSIHLKGIDASTDLSASDFLFV